MERAREREREREGQSGGRRKARSPSNGRGNGRLAERARRRRSGQRREREDEGLSGHERAFPRPPRMRRASVPVASPCHPTQVIGHPLRRPLRSLVPRARAALPVLVAPRRVVPSVIRARTVASFTSSSHSPVSLSLSFSLGDLFSVATPLSPPGPWSARSPFLLRCLSLPPDIRIDSSAARRGPVRRSFSPPRSFSVCLARAQYSFPPLVSRCAARRGAARRFTVRLVAVGSDVHLAPRSSYPPSLFPPPSRNECCSNDYRRSAHRRYCLVTDA